MFIFSSSFFLTHSMTFLKVFGCCILFMESFLRDDMLFVICLYVLCILPTNSFPESFLFSQCTSFLFQPNRIILKFKIFATIYTILVWGNIFKITLPDGKNPYKSPIMRFHNLLHHVPFLSRPFWLYISSPCLSLYLITFLAEVECFFFSATRTPYSFGTEKIEY